MDWDDDNKMTWSEAIPHLILICGVLALGAVGVAGLAFLMFGRTLLQVVGL